MQYRDMLDFPLEEYQARLDKLTAGLRRDGLDAIFLTSAENLRYFIGLQSVVWPSPVSIPGVLIITADGKAMTVSSRSSLGPIRASTWIEEEDMVGIQHGESYVDAIYNTFEKLHLTNARIGMEWGTGFIVNLQSGYYFPLMERLKASGAQFADAARLLWELRTIKSVREQEYIRKAVQVAEQMFDAAFSGIVLDKTTERDIFGMMAATALENGCEDILPMVVRYGLERMIQVNCPSSERVVITNTPHAILQLDGGPCYKGYFADIIRQAVVGGLTPEQEEYEKVAIEALESGLAVIREGVRIEEVTKAVDAVFDRYGCHDRNDSNGWSGHGIGVDVHEEPQIALGSDYVLKAGMTLSVEPGMKIPGLGSFCNEQNLVVTKNGYELFNTSPLKMRVIK